MEKRKGVILCGGKGTRMLPATKVTNKHMIPVLNVPMVVYPLQTLEEMGVTDILIISGGNHIGDIAEFLGDGSDYGVKLTYKVQKEAGGIAQALSLAEDFVGKEQFVVILGDNYFETPPELPTAWNSCQFVVKQVEDPQRFGVYYPGRKFYAAGMIEEKPINPQSNLAVIGLYVYLPSVFGFIKTLSPSDRGELEITDVNNWCIKNETVTITEYEKFWSDMGTPESMMKTIKHLHG